MDQDAVSILEVLETIVLAPLDPASRKRILGWVEKEIASRAIVQYVYDEGGPVVGDVGGPCVWQLGQPSPVNATETVFAMFHWESSKAIAVYTFQQVEADGKTGTLYYRTLLFKPIHVHGPVEGTALQAELGAFLDEEPEPPAAEEPEQLNGATP
ncbi:MAG: hypothetical protein ACREU5_06900 [Burkholderiales bacterium]